MIFALFVIFLHLQMQSCQQDYLARRDRALKAISRCLSPLHLNFSLTRVEAYRVEWGVILGSKHKEKMETKRPSAGSLLFFFSFFLTLFTLSLFTKVVVD